MHCNRLPSPALCKVFELGIDRANEVELLFASPAFELFFPSDGCANVFLTLKVEQALVKSACMAAENVDVAAGHSKMLAVLVVGPRERSWRARQARASVVEKLRTPWVR
jgi:hypothetical protein